MITEPEFVKSFLRHRALGKVRQFDTLKELAEALLDEAIELYDEYTKANPGDDDALAGFGGALRRKGDLAGAAEKYGLALEANPESSYAAVNLVGLHAILDDLPDVEFAKYRSQAIKLNQQIIDQNKDDHWTWYDAATLQLLDNNLTKALENLELAIGKTKADRHFDSVVSNLNTLRQHRLTMRDNIDKMLEVIRIRRAEKQD